MNNEVLINQCTQAYINAFLAAKTQGLPPDDCTLVARLSYDACFQLLTTPGRPAVLAQSLNA
jgi:hypothetical protein